MWNFKQHEKGTAFVDDQGQSLSYAQLIHEVDVFSSFLRQRALVTVFCSNTIGAILGYISCIQNRTICQLVSQELDDFLADGLIETYQPDYLWLPATNPRASSGTVLYKRFGYVLVEIGASACAVVHEDLALLLATSGSTGSPKFVRLSYGNLRSNTSSIAKYLELTREDRPITSLPMNYSYGLSVINTHLFIGATIVLTTKGIMQKEFWTLFKNENCTSLSGVPYTYEMLNRLRFYRMDLPSLRTLTQAGGHLSHALQAKLSEYAQRSSIKLFIMYGQTEATARMSYVPPEYAERKIGSIGIPIPEGKFELIDEEGNEIRDPQRQGELVYRGPNVSMGYAENRDDLARGDERDGVLLTGDLAKKDEDGFYYIVGRKKRFLKIYGNRVNLDELESLIRDEFDSAECACAGTDDHVYVFSTEASIASAMRAYLAKKTGLYEKAFTPVVLDEIPKNESGKTLYSDLSFYYES